MTYGVFNSAAFKTASGLAVAPLASVEVRREVDNALAPIFSTAAGAALGNPFAADAQGRFALFAAGLALGYKVTVTSGAEVFTLRNVPIGTAMYLDDTTFALAADLAAKADLASPVLTGNPTAPTATPGDADTSIATTAFVAAAIAASGASVVLPRSLAPNPFFQIDQRVNSATSRANDVYASDRWYALTQTAAIAVTAQANQEDGQPSSVRLSQSQAAAQRFGYATIIEGKNCRHLRGAQVTFRPRVRISASQAVRIAILEWTGTEDAVTSDVVNSWTNGTFTAGQFFKATTTTVSGVGAKTPAANTWTDMDALTVTLGSTFTNLILMVWVEAVAAQNVTLDIGKARFVKGSYAGEIEIANFSEELKRCQRYFAKSFAYGTAPAQNVASVLGAIAGFSIASTFSPFGVWRFPSRMRIPPTIVTFNPNVANANWRNALNTLDSVVSVQAIGDGGIVLQGGANSSEVYYIHATAEAEL